MLRSCRRLLASTIVTRTPTCLPYPNHEVAVAVVVNIYRQFFSPKMINQYCSVVAATVVVVVVTSCRIFKNVPVSACPADLIPVVPPALPQLSSTSRARPPSLVVKSPLVSFNATPVLKALACHCSLRRDSEFCFVFRTPCGSFIGSPPKRSSTPRWLLH